MGWFARLFRRRLPADVPQLLRHLRSSQVPLYAKDEIAAILVDCEPDQLDEIERELVILASRPSLEDELADAYGETLGMLWAMHDRLNFDLLGELDGTARRLAVGTLANLKPQWRQQLRERGFLDAS